MKHFTEVDRQTIVDTMNLFKNYYFERNTSKILEFYKNHFVDDETTYIVGTGYQERARGPNQIQQLIQSDWEYWGTLDLNLETLKIIEVAKDVASIIIEGQIISTLEEEKFFSNIIIGMKEHLESDLNAISKAMRISGLMDFYLNELDKGKEVISPIHLSGTIVKDLECWKFRFLQFSFDTALSPPDIRLINNKIVYR